MKVKSGTVMFLMALSVIAALMGAGCSGADFAGAVAQGIYAGLTGDEEGAAQVGQQVKMEVEEENRKKALLAKVPPDWKVEGAQIYFSEQVNTYVYVRPDNSWLKWNGSQWVLGE